MLVLLLLCLLILIGVFGVRMGRSMSQLFGQLELNEPVLWKDLAKPSVGFRDPAGCMRASEIMFSGSRELAAHPELQQAYIRARRWWFYFQGAGLALFMLLVIWGVTNAQ